MSTDRKALIAITDDVWIQRIIYKLFQHCSYKLLHVGKAKDAIRSVGDVKETIDLILTNVPRAEQVGPQLCDEIENFGLPLILMGLKDDLIQWRGEEDTEVVAYLLFDLRIDDLISIWNCEMEPENGENREANPQGYAQMDSMTQNEKADIKDEQQLNQAKHGKEFMVENSESHKEARWGKEHVTENEQGEEARKGKRVAESKDGEEKGKAHSTEKKPRMAWSKEMHDKFVEIFELLGPDRAFPKKITEMMNDPELTRESVASHLQKYRLSLRKAEEENSKKGTHSKKNVTGSSVLPYDPISNFNNALAYSGFPMWTNGSLLLQQPSPAHSPAGSAQGPYQQQYYSSLSTNQIIPQESFNYLLARSQLPGSVSPFQPQSNNIGDPARNCLPGSQNFDYNQVLPDSLIQTGSYQNSITNLYPSNPILPQNPFGAMNNIPQPHASIQSSGINGYNAPIEGLTASVRQFSTHQSSGIDDVEFSMLQNEMAREGPQIQEPKKNEDSNFDHGN